jgi:ABC-2 type transport system ATP-binding protein
MTLSNSASVVSLDGATVTLGGECALRPTSFAIAGGEAVVVRGPSGSGKSTLLRVVVGLLAPTGGSVALWGKSVHDRSLRERRIGMTIDESSLWPWMRADQALRCLAGLSGRSLSREDTRRSLEEVALGDAHALRVSKMSQGMRRRLQLAGALAVGDDLLLVDEPTASLDHENAFLVWNILERRRESGTAIVVATHDTSFADVLSGEVVELHAGDAPAA